MSNIVQVLNQTLSGVPPSPKTFFIMNRWISNDEFNAPLCGTLDRFNRGRVNPELLCNMLATGVKKSGGFLQFIKKTKDPDEKLIEELRQYFGMSTYEFSIQRKYLDIDDPVILKEVADALGWDSRKCKKYGIEYVKPSVKKLKKVKKPQGKSLFSF